MHLDAAAQRYVDSFPPVEEMRVEGLDVVPVHLRSAVLDASPQHAGGSGLGFGATDAEARVGALGEMAELALSGRALRTVQPVVGSYRDLLRQRGARGVADPLTLCLEAGSAYDHDRVLHWHAMTRWTTGEEVLVPAELVASSVADLPGGPPPRGWLTTVLTNGQGAAFDVDRALSHALLELVQRDGNATSYRALDRGLVVDLDLPLDDDTGALLADLDAAGIEVQVKLAGDDLGIVSLFAVGMRRGEPEPVPLMATACGEAAHPDPVVAVRKALFELVAARSRKAFMHGPLDVVRRATPAGYLDRWQAAHPLDAQVAAEEPRALRAMQEWAAADATWMAGLVERRLLVRTATVPLSSLPHPTAPATGAALVEHLEQRGLDVLVHVRPSAGEAVAVKVVVPTTEVETMSYGRVGERGVRRLVEAGTGLAAVGPDPGGWARVHLTDEAQERLGGPAWFDREGADRVVGPLYPLYREPGRHVVARLARR
jgi:ribosomal protein S12 methylthiotransferase accessory factor YcaO